jgi:hypothetical protein
MNELSGLSPEEKAAVAASAQRMGHGALSTVLSALRQNPTNPLGFAENLRMQAGALRHPIKTFQAVKESLSTPEGIEEFTGASIPFLALALRGGAKAPKRKPVTEAEVDRAYANMDRIMAEDRARDPIKDVVAELPDHITPEEFASARTTLKKGRAAPPPWMEGSVEGRIPAEIEALRRPPPVDELASRRGEAYYNRVLDDKPPEPPEGGTFKPIAEDIPTDPEGFKKWLFEKTEDVPTLEDQIKKGFVDEEGKPTPAFWTDFNKNRLRGLYQKAGELTPEEQEFITKYKDRMDAKDYSKWTKEDYERLSPEEQDLLPEDATHTKGWREFEDSFPALESEVAFTAKPPDWLDRRAEFDKQTLRDKLKDTNMTKEEQDIFSSPAKPFGQNSIDDFRNWLTPEEIEVLPPGTSHHEGWKIAAKSNPNDPYAKEMVEKTRPSAGYEPILPGDEDYDFINKPRPGEDNAELLADALGEHLVTSLRSKGSVTPYTSAEMDSLIQGLRNKSERELPMDPHGQELDYFTDPNVAEEMNRVLREGGVPDEVMEKLMKKFSLKEDVPLFRGTYQTPEDILLNKPNKAYSSWTVKPEVAKIFAEAGIDENKILLMLGKKGQPGIRGYEGEGEIILPRGMSLTQAGDKFTEGGITHIPVKPR